MGVTCIVYTRTCVYMHVHVCMYVCMYMYMYNAFLTMSCREVCWQSPNETEKEHMEREVFHRGQEEGEGKEETGIQSVALTSLSRVGSFSIISVAVVNVYIAVCYACSLFI